MWLLFSDYNNQKYFPNFSPHQKDVMVNEKTEFNYLNDGWLARFTLVWSRRRLVLSAAMWLILEKRYLSWVIEYDEQIFQSIDDFHDAAMVTISAGPILLPDAGFQWLDNSCLVSGETFKPSIVIRLSIQHLRNADLLFFFHGRTGRVIFVHFTQWMLIKKNIYICLLNSFYHVSQRGS